MPRFFFHVDDGVSTPDTEGTDLPDLNTARIEAVKASGTILEDFDGDFWQSGKPWVMIVTDDAGLLLFELCFSARIPSGQVRYKPVETTD